MNKEEEITVANFINLSLMCVGAGIIPTGSKNFELATSYANQKSIEFAGWIINKQYSIVQWMGAYYFTDGTGIKNYKTPFQLHQLFLQQPEENMEEE